MESCVRVGLLALPLPGAGVTFFAAAKKVTKESSFSSPAVTRSLAMLASPWWPSPKCRPHRPNRAWIAHGLTHRTALWNGSAPNSFGTALRAAVGYARETIEKKHAQTRLTHRPRSGPELFGAEPARLNIWCCRPCAVQALICLWGHSLLPGHSANRLCRGRCEVLRLGRAVSLVTFFAAAKKVTAAPHRGSANRPTRNQDSPKAKAKAKTKAKAKAKAKKITPNHQPHPAGHPPHP